MNIVLFAFCQTHFRLDYLPDAGRRQIETDPTRVLHLKSTGFGIFFKSHGLPVQGYLNRHSNRTDRFYSAYGFSDVQYMVIYFNKPQYILIQLNYT